MIRLVGRALQTIGMVILPVAIFAQLTESISLGKMFVMATFGISAFYIGRIVEGYTGSK